MDVLIIGAGGHGRVVLDIIRTASEHAVVGFLDADASLAGQRVAGVPVLGAVNLLSRLKAQQRAAAAIVAIGDARVRRSHARLVEDAGLQLLTVVHPHATVASTATIGRNVVIAAGARVCADANIADGVIVNTNAVVEHECEVAAESHICPGALLAGRVRVGAGAFIGLGAKIIPCVSIGAEATIGAGAVVLQDVPAQATAVGVPARIIRTRQRAA
jgi:sugar O-acyltransferase (sialic acid O-acetyltransferase NeuD family)